MNSYKETFVESTALVRDKRVRLHTHLGEGENASMLECWGMRFLNWCEKLGFTGPDVWFAVSWEFNTGELERMARAETGLSHCLTPAVLGGFPLLDISTIDRVWLSLSPGCDGSATNDGSNFLDILRMAYLMQCFHSKNRGGSSSPYRMLKAAALGGAQQLERPLIILR